MKKINIKPEKPAVSDEQIASTKAPFAELLKQYKALPMGKSGLNHGNWWIIGGITLVSITSIILLNNWNQPSLVSEIKSQAKTELIAEPQNLDTTKKIQSPQLQNPVIDQNRMLNKPFVSQVKTTTNFNLPITAENISVKDTVPQKFKSDTSLANHQVNPVRKCNSRMPDCSGLIQSEKYNSGSYGNTLVLTEEDGLYGFKSTTGSEVVKPKYDKIYPFGVYRLSWALVEKDGLYGFINMFGSEVVQPKYNHICNFGEYNPNWALVEKDGLFGFLAINGSEMVKPKYDRIGKYGEYDSFLALVEKDGLLGFINRLGTEVTQPKYNHIYPFGENIAGFAIVEKNGLQGLINSVGIEMIKPKYDKIHKFGELRAHCAVVEKDGLFGMVAIDGDEMIKLEYMTIEEMKDHIINPNKINKTGRATNTNHTDNIIRNSDPNNSGEVKIIKINGDTLNAIISNYNSCKNIITFKQINKKISETINRTNIRQLIFSNGKIENISTPIVISGENDWEKVRITYNENEVCGLKNLGEVNGKSTKMLRFKAKLTSLAEKELKIQAARKHAFIILVNCEKSRFSFINSIELMGIAYGY